MKSISTKILSLMICLELVLAPFPKTAAASDEKAPESVTSPAAYLKAVQAEAESLFDPKTGCASIDENGNAKTNDDPNCKIVNLTTQEDIHGDPKNEGSLDCAARLEAFVPAWNKAQQIVKEYEKADKSDKNGAQCADCKANEKVLNTDFLVPAEGLCSKKEKDAIAKQYKNDPKCEWGFSKIAPAAAVAVVVAPVLAPIAVAAAFTNPASCLYDIGKTFLSSMKSMANTALDGMGAAGNWLFKSHSAPEKAGSEKSLILSGMDAESIRRAQENGPKATDGFVQKTLDFLGNMIEFIGIDTPAYKELYKCAKCGERANAICKMVGVLGKDIVKNAIIVWASGNALKALNIGRKAAARGLSKSKSGSAFLAWGDRAGARISEGAINGWKSFEKNWLFLSKVTKWVAKGGFKLLKGMDDLSTYPQRLAVSGGEKLAASRVGMKIRSKVFSKTPGLKITAEGETAGLTSVEKISGQPSPLLIEANRVPTAKMQEGARIVANAKPLKPGVKVDISDVVNATDSKFTTAGSAVKAETPYGERYFNVKTPDEVQNVFPYGPEGKSAIIKMKDGNILLAEEGRISSRVAKKDIKKVEALFDPAELQKSDDLLLKQTTENAKMNGVTMTAEVESKLGNKVGESKATFNTGPDCGNKLITVRAGRAF